MIDKLRSTAIIAIIHYIAVVIRFLIDILFLFYSIMYLNGGPLC